MNRFDLEQKIMNCWNVVDDLKVIIEAVDNDKLKTMDEVSTLLHGLANLYHIKFEDTFECFEHVVTTKQLPL